MAISSPLVNCKNLILNVSNQTKNIPHLYSYTSTDEIQQTMHTVIVLIL